MLHVALYHPVIPQNTGSIARQCVGMAAHLHLIGPLGFEISDQAVKRAGLDYWEHLRLTYHETDDAFLNWLGARQPWLVTKFGEARYDQPNYGPEDVLLFGNENTGLPLAWRQRWADRCVGIPILGQVRSYNLSNAVAIVLAQATLRSGKFDAPAGG